MTLLDILFFMVLFGSNCVLPLTNHYDSSDPDVRRKGALFHKLLKRQADCPSDEYFAENHCCKKCMEGTYAQSHCDMDHHNSTCKPCTDGVDYMDEKNGYQHCLACRRCDSMSGQELLQNCTVSQNSKCKCREGFFCKEEKGVDSEDCTDCQHCTQCDYGVSEPCTATTDAVCKPPRNHKIIMAAVALVILLIIYLICKSCCSNKEFQQTKRDEEFQQTKRDEEFQQTKRGQCPIFPDDLQDIDLTNHLPSFAEELELNTILMSVRKMGMTEATIEAVRFEHERIGIYEIKIQLLNKWYDSHGRAGAFQRLITTLRTNKNSNSADKLILLVRA